MHEARDVQATDSNTVSVPIRGLGTTDHDEPFHDSTSACCASGLPTEFEAPTATHDVDEMQATAWSRLWFPGLRGDMIDQGDDEPDSRWFAVGEEVRVSRIAVTAATTMHPARTTVRPATRRRRRRPLRRGAATELTIGSRMPGPTCDTPRTML